MTADIYVQCRISHFFLFFFLLLFLRLRYSFVKSIVISAMSFLLCAVLDLIALFFALDGIAYQLITIPQIILLQGTAFLLDEYRDFRTLFTGFTASAYVMAGNTAGLIAYVITKNYTAVYYTVFAAQSFTLFLLYIFLRKNYREAQRTRPAGWFPLCFVPGFFYCTFISLVSYPSKLTDIPSNVVAAVFMMLTMLFSYLIIFWFIAQQRKNSELLRNSDLLETGKKQIMHEVQLIHEEERKASMLRHDMRHYIQTMAGYLKSREYEKLEQSFDEITALIDDVKRMKYCSNIAVNGIVSYYGETAQRKNISFTAALDLPAKLPVSELEYGAVISNLLDNAINAAAAVEREEDRRIKIYARRIKGQILLEISNTFYGQYSFSEETGLPLSENGEGHGFGMRSVTAFAQKYGAAFDYTIEGNLFCVRLLLSN